VQAALYDGRCQTIQCHLRRSPTAAALGEHTPDLVECVRRIAQMNDAVAVGAKNGKVFHSRSDGVRNFGQWQ
jgi:hypothetical protein